MGARRCLTGEPMLLTKTKEVGVGQCQAQECNQDLPFVLMCVQYVGKALGKDNKETRPSVVRGLKFTIFTTHMENRSERRRKHMSWVMGTHSRAGGRTRSHEAAVLSLF